MPTHTYSLVLLSLPSYTSYKNFHIIERNTDIFIDLIFKILSNCVALNY